MKSIYDDCPEILKEFIGYQSTVKGRSPKTVEEYYLDLRTFFRYLLLTHGLVDNGTEFTYNREKILHYE